MNNANIKSPGRPRGDSDSRNLILDAAEICFGTDGYGTGIRAISRRAGVNTATIYHHFGNKEGLFREVLRRKFTPLAQALETMAENCANAPIPSTGDPLEIHFRNVAILFGNDPWIRRLMLTEVILSNGPAREFFIEEIISRIRGTMMQLIECGIRTGRYRSDIDPVLTLISVASLAIAPNLLKELMENVIGQSMNESFMMKLAGHNADMLANGLR
jgi:AcrR family transcriptional regulator